MMSGPEWLDSFVTGRHVFNVAIAIFFITAGFIISRRLSHAVMNLSRLDRQQRLLLSKATHYGLLTLAVTAGLNQVGMDLKVLLGAAGVLTVAIGFAAQTSTSNLISGLFLMGERPFGVGDIISVGEIRGEVMSIDLLSTKIRAFNNLMVRVPNETLVKSNVVNHSFFPIRRLDLDIGISYATPINEVEMILKRVANDHPLCLAEPEPVFVFNGFGDSAMMIQFQVWTLRENVLTLQNELYRDIKAAFDRARIDIPFPTRTLITPPRQ